MTARARNRRPILSPFLLTPDPILVGIETITGAGKMWRRRMRGNNLCRGRYWQGRDWNKSGKVRIVLIVEA